MYMYQCVDCASTLYKVIEDIESDEGDDVDRNNYYVCSEYSGAYTLYEDIIDQYWCENCDSLFVYCCDSPCCLLNTAIDSPWEIRDIPSGIYNLTTNNYNMTGPDDGFNFDVWCAKCNKEHTLTVVNF